MQGHVEQVLSAENKDMASIVLKSGEQIGSF